MFKDKKAFTLIELLVVIAIIAVIATFSVLALQSVRVKARDAKRIDDVKQLKTALELYYNDANGYPPTSAVISGSPLSFIESSNINPSNNQTKTYINQIPSTPSPADGDCNSANNAYVYVSEDPSTYTISYCLGTKSQEIPEGPNTATPVQLYEINRSGNGGGGGSCTDAIWTPDPSSYCGDATQTSNCNNNRTYTGTLICDAITYGNNAQCNNTSHLCECIPSTSGVCGADDGCFGTIQNGTCAQPNYTCQFGTCACTPESDSTFCTRLGATCGSLTQNDNCGNSRTVANCGTCSGGQICSNNSCLQKLAFGESWYRIKIRNDVLGGAYWYSASLSSDGQKMLATAYNGSYTSSDSGFTWVEGLTGSDNNTSFWLSDSDISSNGLKVSAVGYDSSYVYTSSDGGVSWARRLSAGQRNWRGIAMSDDGVKLAAVAQAGNIYTSSDSGVTWTARDSARNWYVIDSSPNGQYLIAAVGYSGNGYIYTSSDSGVTWTARTGPGSRSWRGVAVSSNGTKMVAISYGNYIYTSSDSGVTWTSRTAAGARNWGSLSASDDGTKIVAAVYNGYIYTSSDSGVTWTQRTSAGSRYWQDISNSSLDGSTILALTFGSYAYISRDSGVTWEQKGGDGVVGDDSAYALESSSDGQEMFFNYYGDNGFYVSHNYGANWEKKTSSNITQWYLFDSSSTGQKVIASANDNSGNNYLYSSSDYGNTWTKNTAAGARSWYDVSSSSDGTKLAAAVYGGYIYMSSDSGTTWTQNNAAGSRNWYATDSSNDGNTLAAIVYGGYIYVTNNSGQSWTEKTSLGSKNWYDIALSGDGKYMIAAADYIYVSSDYGVTWNSISALGSKVWYHVDVSEEGLKMAAAVYGGFVYFSQDSGLTWTDGKSAKSWGSVDLNSNSIFAHNLNFQNLYYSNNNCAVAYISKPDGSCCQRESDYVFCNRFSYCGQNVKLLAIDNCDSERYVDCSTCQP